MEFKVEALGPILFVSGVLRFELFAKFGFPLVAIAGQTVLNLSLSSVTVRGEFVLFAVFKLGFDLRLQAS